MWEKGEIARYKQFPPSYIVFKRHVQHVKTRTCLGKDLENILGKGGIVGHKQLLLLQQCFLFTIMLTN